MSALPNSSPAMRALIYNRVSLDKRSGRSVAEQEADSLARVVANGWQLVATLTDNSVSGSELAKRKGVKRPAWDRVKAMIASGEVDVLVTWADSRAQRDLEAYTELRRLCDDHGVIWSSGSQLYDMSRASDRLTSGLLAVVAENQTRETQEAVKRTVRANVALGRPAGRRLYGYDRVYDMSTNPPTPTTQTPNPDEAPVVREMFARFAKGESLRSIATDLNERNVPTPGGKGDWTNTTVRNALRAKSYRGIRTHLGVEHPGNWPALIDARTWKRVQTRLDDPARVTNRDRYDLAHPLSGCAVCGTCGKAMRFNRRTSGQTVYTCSKGGHVARDAETLEAYIIEQVLAWCSQPGVRALVVESVEGEHDNGDERVAELRAQLDEAYDAWEAGQISAVAFGRREAKLQPMIDAAEASVRHASSLPDSVVELLGPRARTVWASWHEAGNVAHQRDAIRALVAITVMPAAKRGRAPFDPDAIVLDWRYRA